MIGIVWGMGFSQSISDNNGRPNNQEIQLSVIDSQIQKLQQKQNALQNKLNHRLSQSDSLKAAGASENTLADFTAASFVVSQKFEAAATRLKQLGTQRQKLRNQLYQFYSHKIDSVSGLPVSPQKEQELFVLMSKRLQVSPLASRMHFNPQQLSTIDAGKNDSLAQVIYKGYLKNAARELESEIKILREKEQEIGEIAALESKAEEFMQEMEESGMLQTVPAGDIKPQESGMDYSGNTANARNLVTANEQALSFFRILNQLQNNTNPLSANAQPLTYSQLLEKLKAARQLLEGYRRQVSDKLKHLTDK